MKYDYRCTVCDVRFTLEHRHDETPDECPGDVHEHCQNLCGHLVRVFTVPKAILTTGSDSMDKFWATGDAEAAFGEGHVQERRIPL